MYPFASRNALLIVPPQFAGSADREEALRSFSSRLRTCGQHAKALPAQLADDHRLVEANAKFLISSSCEVSNATVLCLGPSEPACFPQTTRA